METIEAKQQLPWGWREGSALKSIYCTWKRLRFNSQNPLGGLQLPVLLLPVYRAHELIQGITVTQGMNDSRKVTTAKDRPSHCHIHTEDSRDLKKTVWTCTRVPRATCYEATLHWPAQQCPDGRDCTGTVATAQSALVMKKIKDHVCPLVEGMIQFGDETWPKRQKGSQQQEWVFEE